jgi:hypothetical protein
MWYALGHQLGLIVLAIYSINLSENSDHQAIVNQK